MQTLSLVSRPQSYADGGVLNYYDGPLLMILESTDGSRYLASALAEGEEGPWPFFLTDLAPEIEEMLQGNEMTLRDAVEQGRAWWLLPDYGAEVLTVTPVDEVPDDWLPEDVLLGSLGE